MQEPYPLGGTHIKVGSSTSKYSLARFAITYFFPMTSELVRAFPLKQTSPPSTPFSLGAFFVVSPASWVEDSDMEPSSNDAFW